MNHSLMSKVASFALLLAATVVTPVHAFAGDVLTLAITSPTISQPPAPFVCASMAVSHTSGPGNQLESTAVFEVAPARRNEFFKLLILHGVQFTATITDSPVTAPGGAAAPPIYIIIMKDAIVKSFNEPIQVRPSDTLTIVSTDYEVSKSQSGRHQAN